jgi:hypothetical protein
MVPLEAPIRPAARWEKRKPWLALAAVLALAASLLGIALGTNGSGSKSPVKPRTPPVQQIGRGGNARQQARNLSAWLRRYSR